MNVDFSKIHPHRSGIIPYVKVDGKVFFLLGVDTKTKELSDFGGGVKANENALSGGLRECLEELRWIINFQDLDIITQGIMEMKHRHDICIMFAMVKDPTFFHTARKRFHAKKYGLNPEMSDIVWFSEEDLLKYSRITCKDSRIWSRIRSTLSKCGSFNREFIKRL